MTMVHHQPANDNDDRSFEQLVTKLVAAMQSGEVLQFGEYEAKLLRATNEAVRRCLETRLQRVADSFADEVVVDGFRYRRHQPGRVRYFSLCGVLVVDRWTYRRVDQRNGATIVALDKGTGIAECATPGLAFAVVQGIAKAPVRHVEQALRAAFRCPPSRSKMDRIGRNLGDQVHQLVEAIEPLLRASEQLPDRARAINLGLDRTTIPMEEQADEEDPTAKIVVRYRMGYVGTFCITNHKGEALATRRYAVPAHEGPNQVIARMKADLEHALEQRPSLTIGVVQDGASEMWNLMRDMLDSIPQLARPKRMGKPRHWRETIDRYHLMAKLARVLELLIPRNEKRRARIYATWDADLDRSDGAVRRIDEWIKLASFRAPRYVSDEVHRQLGNYFLCPHQFRYASLPPGLHQGSGVTEGACKSLITMRAKRSGQRWRPIGIRAVLALRSLLDSERLSTFWSRFATRFVATITNVA